MCQYLHRKIEMKNSAPPKVGNLQETFQVNKSNYLKKWNPTLEMPRQG